MKKTGKTESTSTIHSKADATSAFARGDMLSKTMRKGVVMKVFVNRISLAKACLIAFKYGLGLISEEKANLQRLTLAWLRLGEKKWRRIAQEAQSIYCHFTFGEFASWVRRNFAGHRPSWTW
ncbi:MAG: hypothetical protein ABI430_01015 [Candidatus Taylorbacteria bacterium]